MVTRPDIFNLNSYNSDDSQDTDTEPFNHQIYVFAVFTIFLSFSLVYTFARNIQIKRRLRVSESDKISAISEQFQLKKQIKTLGLEVENQKAIVSRQKSQESSTVSTLKKEVDALKDNNQKLKGIISSNGIELGAQRNQMAQYRKSQTQQQKKIIELQKKLQSIEQQKHKLEQLAEEKSEQILNLKTSLRKSREVSESLQAEKNLIEHSHQDSISQVEILSSKIQEYETTVQQLQQEKNETEADYKRLMVKLALLLKQE